VLSFLYIVASVTLLAIGSPWPGARFGESSAGWLFGSWIGFALLSMFLGWLPLRTGLRKVSGFEL